MRIITIFLIVLVLSLSAQKLAAQDQDNGYLRKIEMLKEQRTQINQQEKDALKFEIEEIYRRLNKGQISDEEARILKGAAAEKRAKNIENRISIVDHKIALLERNEGNTLVLSAHDTTDSDQIRVGIDINGKPAFSFKTREWKRKIKYDRRTYSDFVLAIGLNNALVEGQSINDSPYKIGGSRFFEMGWSWRTRVFKNTNFLRFNYGFSFQFNGLKPKGNQYFVAENGEVSLQEFEYDLKKSKIRMDNLVFPVHFEIGPSKQKKTDTTFRYTLQDQFRLGFGGYAGFNLGTRQKLKYNRNGENVKDKLKRGYNTNELVYGLSAYVGFDGMLLYAKYDLNPIFKDALVEQNNISLGLRFDL